MSTEIDAGGALTHAALAAHSLQPSAPGHGAPPARCANCGATLSGPFCGQCGQRAHLHRSIGDVVHDVLHGITHFDGRFWTTLPMLLLRPGRLTRSYIDGQRARYVAPVPMFLLVVFLMFFALSFMSWNDDIVTVNTSTGELQHTEAEVAQALAEIDRDIAAARAAGRAAQVVALQSARGVIEGMVPQPAEAPTSAASAVSAASAAATPAPAPARSRSISDRLADEIEAAARRGEINVNLGVPSLNEKAQRALENPRLVFYKLQTRAYKLSFLLVPMSLPWLWLVFFWRRGTTMYDHVIFTLYSISFMSMLFVFASAMVSAAVSTQWVWIPVLLAPMLHIYVQLRGAYALGWWSALWRTSFLLLAATMTLSLYFVLLVVLGVLD